MDERVIEAVIGLVFDKRDSAQTRTAHVCVDQIYAHLGREGLWPYRVGVQSMHQIVRPEDPFWQTIRDLKSALDPNNILAPGRYNLA